MRSIIAVSNISRSPAVIREYRSVLHLRLQHLGRRTIDVKEQLSADAAWTHGFNIGSSAGADSGELSKTSPAVTDHQSNACLVDNRTITAPAVRGFLR